MSDRLVKFNLVSNEEDDTEQLTVIVKGKGQFPVPPNHPNFEAILAKARADDPSVLDLFDLALTAGTKFQPLTERISYAHGNLYLDGEPLHTALAEQIVGFVRDGEDDYKPLVNFYEKMATNPQPESVEHLYKFIKVNHDKDTGAFTVTEDGNFIAYKGVASDGNGGYVSTHGGKAIVDGEVVEGRIPNRVGSVVSMPRDEVRFDPSNHCSTGLHVGTFPYASTFGRNGGMLKVLINPRDVVSVPNDSAEKMRVCRYKVLEVIEAPETRKVVPAVSDETEKNGQDIDLSDIRVGDVFEDRDSRRKGSTKKVVEIQQDTVVVESKNALGFTRKREIGKARLLSRKYKRVSRGRKS